VSAEASPVAELRTAVFRVPTDRPEADGTFQWDCTTVVLVEALSALDSAVLASATAPPPPPRLCAIC